MIDEVERARNEANDLFLQLVREATKKGYHVVEFRYTPPQGLFSDVTKDLSVMVRGRAWSYGHKKSFRLESRGRKPFDSLKTDWEKEKPLVWLESLPQWQPWWEVLAHRISVLLGVA